MRGTKEGTGYELKKKRRHIKCPRCGWRLMDASAAVRTRLVIPAGDKFSDYYVKCGCCGTEVGVIKTG